MDENNNDQAPETEVMSVPLVKNLDPKLLVAVVVMILIMVGIVITMLGNTKSADPSQVTPEVVTPATEVGPEKVSAEEVLVAPPPDFPKDIPIEKDAIFSQNSVNDIGEGKMHSVLSFNSNESVSKNFDTYKQYLTDTEWYISNTSEDDIGSSLYAYKRDQEMNVTIAPAINGTEAQSMIIISTINNKR